MVTVTSKTSKQRKPRFVMNSGRDSALDVIRFLADAHGADYSGNDDRAVVTIDGVAYTAERV